MELKINWMAKQATSAPKRLPGMTRRRLPERTDLADSPARNYFRRQATCWDEIKSLWYKKMFMLMNFQKDWSAL